MAFHDVNPYYIVLSFALKRISLEEIEKIVIKNSMLHCVNTQLSLVFCVDSGFHLVTLCRVLCRFRFPCGSIFLLPVEFTLIFPVMQVCWSRILSVFAFSHSLFFFSSPKKSIFCFYFKRYFYWVPARLTLDTPSLPQVLSSLVVLFYCLFHVVFLKRNLLFLFSFSMRSLFFLWLLLRFSLFQL